MALDVEVFAVWCEIVGACRNVVLDRLIHITDKAVSKKVVN